MVRVVITVNGNAIFERTSNLLILQDLLGSNEASLQNVGNLLQCLTHRRSSIDAYQSSHVVVLYLCKFVVVEDELEYFFF